MSKWMRYLSTVALVAGLVAMTAGCASTQTPQPVPADQMLFKYVNAPDETYKWEKGPVTEAGGGTISDIVLTSQTWRGITWQHLVRIVKPAQVKHQGWVGLMIGGGSGKPEPGKRSGEDALIMAFANAMQAPLATLTLVPNQPLFGGMVEDEIISHTFREFVKDGDPTWPLLFPMAKSAVRAMDAIQAYGKQEWNEDIHSFLVFGGSKRGWTTWLTAAVDGGKRVKAIAPAVIDVLNMPEQMKHQLEMWGVYSEQIADYSSKGLTEMFDSPRGKVLWTSVDPYTYRAKVTIPKLLLLGTNDRYWTTDALNIYWNDLLEPKCVLYVPNAGHSLEQGISRVVATLGAFYRTVAAGNKMPEMSWTREIQGDTLTIRIKAPEAKAARAWVVEADNLDFRPQTWESRDMTSANGVFSIKINRPEGKNLAAFGEVDFVADGQPYTLSTQNAILKK